MGMQWQRESVFVNFNIICRGHGIFSALPNKTIQGKEPPIIFHTRRLMSHLVETLMCVRAITRKS